MLTSAAMVTRAIRAAETRRTPTGGCVPSCEARGTTAATTPARTNAPTSLGQTEGGSRVVRRGATSGARSGLGGWDPNRTSGQQWGGALRVDLVALDGVGHCLRLDLSHLGQDREHCGRDVLGVNLEETPERLSGVRTAEAVGPQ